MGVYVVECGREFVDSLEPWARERGMLVRAFRGPDDFLRDAPHLAAGCVIVERPAGDHSGVELVRRLQDEGLPFTVILILAADETDVTVAVEAMKAGARDVLQKPVAPEALAALLSELLPRNAAGLQQASTARDVGRGLSARELDVLHGVLAGKTNKQIANDCGISQRTVEAYRSRLMAKMGVTSVAALIRCALSGEAEERPPKRRLH